MNGFAGDSLSQFQFLAPAQVAFGWGRRALLGELARPLGRRALVVASRSANAHGGDELVARLVAQGIGVERIACAGGEPTVADVDALVSQLKSLHAGPGDFVVAVGGGSAIDRGKAAAALAPQLAGASVRDYLEGVGRGLKLEQPPLPVVAIPTTAGTGTEATKNAVISVAEPPCKKSLRSDAMMPRVVIVDPELTVSSPPDVTAHSGMDAITQLIEGFVSRRATPFTRALALEGLKGTRDAVLSAHRDPTNKEARSRMAYAALLSGMTLANGGLGLAHGVAAALGVVCDVPHGLACAMLLPAAMRFNCPGREMDFAQVQAAMTGDDASGAQGTVKLVDELLQSLGVPRRLGEVGVRADQLDALVAGSRGNSMDGNPRDVSDAQLRKILEELL